MRLHGTGSAGRSSQDTIQRCEQLLAAFSHASAIGFCICDTQMRYELVNPVLAATHGIAAEAHVGNTVRAVVARDIADDIEFAFRRVLATRENLLKRISGTAPANTGVGHWIATYFPINCAGGVKRLGAMVVEVTKIKKLDEFFQALSGGLVRSTSKHNWWVARELHDSIDEYYSALAMSLGDLAQNTEVDPSAQLLAHSVQTLDQRIMAMSTLVHDVASRFPIDEDL